MLGLGLGIRDLGFGVLGLGTSGKPLRGNVEGCLWGAMRLYRRPATPLDPL